MNTNQIERLLKNETFDGVFAADELPDKLPPTLLVANTQPSTQEGEHWVCMYIDDSGRYGEYFDSLGLPPDENFETYLNEHCAYWTFNDRQIQSIISDYCGHYAVYYCFMRSRGLDLRKIVNKFTSDTAFNDALVETFVCSLLK